VSAGAAIVTAHPVLPAKGTRVRVHGVTAGTGRLVNEAGILRGYDFRCRMIDVRTDDGYLRSYHVDLVTVTPEGPCGHPEQDRQKLHHNGVPVELCRACQRTRGFRATLPPAAGAWGEWMPGFFGWASAPAFAMPEPGTSSDTRQVTRRSKRPAAASGTDGRRTARRTPDPDRRPAR
jgi:hypothetical protein